MKIIFFTKGDGPEVHEAQELLERILKVRDVEVEMIDTETKEGVVKSETYDIFATPSFVVVMDNGSVIDAWVGKIPAQFEIERALSG